MINGFGQPSAVQEEHEEQPFVPDLAHAFGAPEMPEPAPPAAPAASQANEVGCYLNAGTSIRGMLKASRSVGIDGQFEGEILSEGDVVVGSDGQVKANIKAGNVIISGTVVGNITCSSLEIQSSGRVVGNIIAQSLLIAVGAVFRGQSLMGSDGEAADITLSNSDEPAGAFAAFDGSQVAVGGDTLAAD